jgi:periplasmic copper chaperone A
MTQMTQMTQMKYLAATAALVFALAGVVAAQAAVSASGGVITLPAPGATTAVMSVSIQNPTMYDIYVVSGSTEVAGKVELREDGKAVKELTVASFGSLDLTADGPHVVLADLKRELKEGETIEVTLRTDGGVVLKLAAVVKKP